MKLSRKKAIALCIEHWTWCMKTGKKKKEDWPEWEKYGGIHDDCWFCEYATIQSLRYSHTNTMKTICDYCPLVASLGIQCCDGECYYLKWSIAKTPRTRKKYAKLFLQQIKSIK